MHNSGFLIGYKTKNGTQGRSTHAYRNRNFTLKYIEYLNKKHKGVEHYIMTAPQGTPFIEIIDYSLDSLKYQ